MWTILSYVGAFMLGGLVMFFAISLCCIVAHHRITQRGKQKGEF